MSAYSTAILALSPDVFLRLNDTSGTVATDASGNGRNGVIVGTPSYSQTTLIENPDNTDSDTSMEFDGTDDFVQCDISGVTFGTEFGLHFSFKSPAVGYTELASIYDSVTAANAISIYADDAYVKLWLTNTENPSGVLKYTSSVTLSNNDVHHIHIGYNSSGHYLYIDGVRDQTLSYNYGSDSTNNWATLITSFDMLALNRWETASASAGDGNGQLRLYDEVAIFSTAPTDAQIKDLYANAVGSHAGGSLTAITGTASGTVPNIVAGTGAGILSAITSTVAGDVDNPNNGTGILQPITGTASGTFNFNRTGTSAGLLSAITGSAFVIGLAEDLVLVLTGDADGLSHFEYRLKSLQVTLWNARQSTFNYQLPRQSGDIAAFDARPNGDLVLFYDSVELFRSNPQFYTYNRGATNETLTINGTKQKTYIDPKTVNIDSIVSKISYSREGKRSFTAHGLSYLNPLDSIVYDSETVQIEKVVLNITDKGFVYTLQEI